MSDWYEDEQFWEDTESVIFTEERCKQASGEVDHLLALVEPRAGAAVLDLGCGIGRHSLEFAKHGYQVTGVDRTARYLDRARKSGKEQRLEIEWVQDDMRRFRRDNSFDLVVNLLTSFGYFDDRADDGRILENVAASLKPGGRFVIDLMGKEVLARIFQQRDWHEQPDGTLVLEERKLTDHWNRLDLRWIILKDEQHREQHFTLRLYSAGELKDLLAAAGLSEITAYGSLDGKPYDNAAERLVVVGRK